MITFDQILLNFLLQYSRETKKDLIFSIMVKKVFNVGKRRSNFYYLQVHEVFEFRTLLFQDTALKANKVEEHQLTTASFLFHHSAVYVRVICLKYSKYWPYLISFTLQVFFLVKIHHSL